MTEFGNIFTGQLVRLGAMTNPEYAEAVARWSNDAEYDRLATYNRTRPLSVAQIERWMEKRAKKEEGNEFEFAIRTLDGDKLIGDIGLEVTWNHQVAWMGVGIGEPDYRGRGYGTDAVRVILRYGFQELGLWRIQLGVFSNNPRAIRSYEKAGFKHEVTERASIYRDGQRIDTLNMAILRHEWEAAQQGV
jgi:RimJ/RimL family protein N-acetyltransferase